MLALRGQYGEHAPKWASTYDATADGISAACSAPGASPWDREHCAVNMVSMAWHESRFAATAVGDSAAAGGVDAKLSRGLFQTQKATLGRAIPESAEGQAEAALSLIRTSWKICGTHPEGERLAWYMVGGAGCEKALGISRFRTGEAERLLKRHPFIERPEIAVER
jgi:hypothetical protein